MYRGVSMGVDSLFEEITSVEIFRKDSVRENIWTK